MHRRQQRLRALFIGQVHQHVDAADQLALLVEQRRRVGHEGSPRTVRAFGDQFDAVHRTTFAQRDSHRALIVRQRRAVGREQSPADIPQFAEHRHTARE